MLFLYRPRQTWMPVRPPRTRTDQDGYNLRMQQAYSATRKVPVLAGGEVVEPTGTRITLNGVTVAEFRGDRICSIRQYWDELAVFEQNRLDARRRSLEAHAER